MSHPKNTWPANNVGVDDKKTNIRQLSPYFSSKSDKPRKISKIDTIILHWTGGSTASGAVTTLFGNGNSYHFIIEKDGTIIQTKPILERANHAGKSYGPNGWSVNETSIGISFVTVGGLKKANLIEGRQLEQGIKLMADIHAALQNEGSQGIKWFSTHHQISPKRKEDPYSLEPDMVSGQNIQNQLRKLFNNKVTYWRAGMGPSWPKGLHKDCKCATNRPPKLTTFIEIDGPDGKVKWCKTTKDNSKCYRKGYSNQPYTWEAVDVYINKGKLKSTGDSDALGTDVKTDEKNP